MSKSILISVIIPIYNEQNTILNLLKSFSKLRQVINLEIILINDGSNDNTLSILEDNEALYNKLINLDKNYGKGKAIIEGIKISSGTHIYFQDADLEYPSENLLKFYKKYNSTNADLIIGSRFISDQASILYFWHKLGNILITFLFNIFNNKTLTDVYCCNIFFQKNLLEVHNLKSFGWGQQAEILTYLCNKSNRAIEIGIVYYSRKFEEGKKK